MYSQFDDKEGVVAIEINEDLNSIFSFREHLSDFEWVYTRENDDYFLSGDGFDVKAKHGQMLCFKYMLEEDKLTGKLTSVDVLSKEDFYLKAWGRGTF